MESYIGRNDGKRQKNRELDGAEKRKARRAIDSGRKENETDKGRKNENEKGRQMEIKRHWINRTNANERQWEQQKAIHATLKNESWKNGTL
jgi:hypothetical protein